MKQVPFVVSRQLCTPYGCCAPSPRASGVFPQAIIAWDVSLGILCPAHPLNWCDLVVKGIVPRPLLRGFRIVWRRRAGFLADGPPQTLRGPQGVDVAPGAEMGR